MVPDQAQQEDPAPDQAHQEDLVVVQVDVQADVAAPVQPDIYGGGPEDTSILRTFHRHVATRLWNGKDRGTLKVVSNGRKLTAPLDAYIRGIVDNSGLASLIDCMHSPVDRGLLSAFAERWHRDTCSFHLPVREMTITLDDVSSLLHLPVTGHLFSLTVVGKKEANMMLVSLLRVSHRDLYMVGTFAWGEAALAFLYENLKDAGFYNIRQITGYMTLLQVCELLLIQKILDKVPRQPNSSYEEGRPLSKRQAPLHGTGEVTLVRQSLDRLTHVDVIWMPCEAHRVYRPSHDVSLYRGYITCGSIVFPHLPEKVLLQYGHIQSIPPSPHDAFPVSGISNVHHHFLHYHKHLLEDEYKGPVMTIPGECVDDYLRWYYRISHTYLIPSVDRVADPVPRRVPIVGSTFDGVGDVVSYQGLFQGISERLQVMFARELVTPGTESGVLALDMANSGVEGHRTGKPFYRHLYRRRRDRSTQ
ncbi:Aminotransferase-like, plant mobile domain [Sesbania bispinosa]|nr:Aminotransferase-like, plant mobile domain [Sesbania bispinosa]